MLKNLRIPNLSKWKIKPGYKKSQGICNCAVSHVYYTVLQRMTHLYLKPMCALSVYGPTRIIDDRIESYSHHRHHLKVALPRCHKECFSRRDCAADSRLCRSRVAAKIFIASWNFRYIFNFVFRHIFLKFREILQNSK